MRHLAGYSALLLGLAPVPGAAAPVLDPLFGDGAILQRGQPIEVRGQAEPGERLTATLGDIVRATEADGNGRFAVAFPPLSAGGPFELSIAGARATTRARDILVGDVFLCSGQSNMELSVGQAQDAESQLAASADKALRLFTVHRRTALAPQVALGEISGWRAASPMSVEGFSAACFYMAQDLRRSEGVAVGAIHASWSGSRISAWMGDAALRASGQGESARLRALYARDAAAASRQAGRTWERWWRSATAERPGTEPWHDRDGRAWQPVPRIGYWEDWGVADLQSFNGMIWFRRVVTLTARQARQSATLTIGPVDDADQSWVNSEPAGSGGNPATPRVYSLPAGRLVAGRNVITVNANDSYGKGGMPGPGEAMTLAFADGSMMPLGTGWEYSVERRSLARPPRAPWEDTAGAGTIYNAMIAPLGRIGLKGVAWYQGESDVDLPGYSERMRAMMAGWRRQFGVADLPFAIVQLAAFGTPAAAPSDSGWASLREEQRQAVLGEGGRAALAIALDLGDPLDIHPGEKREVGRRLARAMRSIAYNAADPPSGPRIASAARTQDGGAVLTFADVSGRLVTRSSDRAIGFELCGGGSCRYAVGEVDGVQVTLKGDGKPVASVRYAWADSPVVNLYDSAWLPAGPFAISLP